ncbi:hypothetical protein EVAR_91398_1 [Eumeta japonica]|uniref:Uncharacterized protein n=1 Tax=Eumeta variegata TaxID=151549 RepID=A0A4C1XAZ1_EUMVA|nr:hypothetical protein EVAR_91398_1 [Eumeta japonica]
MKLDNILSIFATFLVIHDISGDIADTCPGFPHCTNDDVSDDAHRHSLSRRKRSLVFPDGSSLQLVFCLQVSALIPIGDIFLYGSTVALAWELPKDPQFLYDFKSFERNAQSRADTVNNIYYLDREGKVIAKVPYKRKMLVNPAFAKRSIQDKKSRIPDHIKQKVKMYKQKLHEMQQRREFLNREHMDAASVRFHRSSRIGLLQKLETAFTALGYDGRACVLRKLCEAGRPRRPPANELSARNTTDRVHGKTLSPSRRSVAAREAVFDARSGHLVRNIFRNEITLKYVINKFIWTLPPIPNADSPREEWARNSRLPKNNEMEENDYQHYDSAHAAAGDCETLYGCTDFIFE